MSDLVPLSSPLSTQVLALRQQMRGQRQRIALQLDAASQRRLEYPRSATMRMLTRHPGLALHLAADLATLVLGARFVRSFAAVRSVTRIVRSA